MTKAERNKLIVGAVVLFLWSRLGSGGGGKGGSTSAAQKQPTKAAGARKDGPGIIDVKSPKLRPATPDELRRFGPRSSTKKRSVEVGAATISASPVLEPHHGPTLPAGYDPAKARAQAPAIAAHLARRGPRAYSHELLARWQRWAGITPDGQYAGSSRGALVAFGCEDPPRPFGAPWATLPYHPPGLRP